MVSDARNSKNCKKAYKEGQYCSHMPDNIKHRMYTMDEFTKYDECKPKHSLLPPRIKDGVLNVLAFGTNKYEKGKWKKCNQMSSYYDACHRHLEQFWNGIDFDEESKLHHIDHALSNLIFLKWLIINKESTDDRESREIRKKKSSRASKEYLSIFRRWKTLFRGNSN